jgi:hypothetical protein
MFVAGYLTCWWFRLRPFAHDVERIAREIQDELKQAAPKQDGEATAAAKGKGS